MGEILLRHFGGPVEPPTFIGWTIGKILIHKKAIDIYVYWVHMTAFFIINFTLAGVTICPSRPKYFWNTIFNLWFHTISPRNSMTWYGCQNDELAPPAAYIILESTEADQLIHLLFIVLSYIMNLSLNAKTFLSPPPFPLRRWLIRPWHLFRVELDTSHTSKSKTSFKLNTIWLLVINFLALYVLLKLIILI